MSAHSAESLLRELEVLLGEEREALMQLDRDTIEAFAARKGELEARLQSAAKGKPFGASERVILERVRQAALANQLLLAHARSRVLGMLTLLPPGNAPGHSATGPAAGQAGAGSTPAPTAPNLRR